MNDDAKMTVMELSEDDVDDLLEAIRHYEDELMFEDEPSGFVTEVLNNLSTLRDRLKSARLKGMH
jgi:hypothetical protein